MINVEAHHVAHHCQMASTIITGISRHITGLDIVRRFPFITVVFFFVRECYEFINVEAHIYAARYQMASAIII